MTLVRSWLYSRLRFSFWAEETCSDVLLSAVCTFECQLFVVIAFNSIKYNLNHVYHSYTHSPQSHLPRTPHQHCGHPRTLTLSQHTLMRHKQQYMHHSHRNNRTHNIGYYDNLTNRPRTTTGLLTPHKHTDQAVKVRLISSYCKST